MVAQIEPGMSLSAALRHALLHELSGACRRASARGALADLELHETRKHIKRARALLRLLPDSHAAGAAQSELRSAAHALGPAREEVAELECVRKLAKSGIASDLSAPLLELVERLSAARLLAPGMPAHADAVDAALAALENASACVQVWSPEERGFSFVAAGLKATYARGRKALARALPERTSENLHALRRHAKTQFYQLDLLQPLWAAQIETTRDELDELATALGEHHDLSLLAPSVGQRVSLVPAEDDRLLAARLRDRLEEIAVLSFPIARRIYAERPRAFVARYAEYFAVWEDETR